MSKTVDKVMAAIFGAPEVHQQSATAAPMNRKERRSAWARQRKIAAEPNRRKYEKRGVRRGRS